MSEEDEVGLSKRIRAVSDEINSVDPHEVSDALVKSLSSRELRSVLRAVLPNHVRLVLSVNATKRNRFVSKPILHNPRSKARLIREDAVTKVLDGVVYNESKGQYIKLRDCTVVDIRQCAETRFKKADALKNEARQYAALADAMEHANVGKVGQLSRQTFADVFLSAKV